MIPQKRFLAFMSRMSLVKRKHIISTDTLRQAQCWRVGELGYICSYMINLFINSYAAYTKVL